MRYETEADIARDALAMWDGGACNPRGVGRSIVEAVDWYVENRGGSDGVRGKAPLAVALSQLLHLLGMGIGNTPHTAAGFDADMAETRRIAAKE